MKNVLLLYALFIVMCINMGYLLNRKDYQSIFIFIISCLIIYLVNHNMIVVLGTSIIIINVIRLLRNVEGFKESEEDKEVKEKVKEKDTENEDIKESFDEDSDEENENISKLKKLNPKVIKALQKLNSININDINEYVNTMKNVIDS